MHGTHWFKLSVIAAIVLGCLYVLAPTAVEILEGGQAGLAKATNEVEVDRSTTPDLEVELGGPAELESYVPVLEARVRAAEVPHHKVLVDEEQIRIVLKPGARPEEVTSLATRPGKVTVYPSADLVGDLGGSAVSAASELVPAPVAEALAARDGVADVRAWDAAVLALQGQPVPDTATAASVTLGPLAAGSMPLTGSLAADTAAVVVALDGSVVGVGWPDGARLRFQALGEPTTEVGAVMASGPLPAKLSPVDDQGNIFDDAEATVTEVESPVPDWFKGLLADTALNLGLDLRGGVDLTLYVGLEEAVLGRVNRDVAQLLKGAEDGEVQVATATRDAIEPVILVHSQAELAGLQSYFAQRMPDYIYRDSPDPVDGVPVHAFEMRDEAIKKVEEQAIEQVLETLRERVDETGVKEPSIVKKGGGRINIQLPGKVDLQAALDAIGTTALLEFRLVDEEFDESELQRIVRAAEKELPEAQFLHDETMDQWLHDTGRLPANRMVQWQYRVEEMPDGTSEKVRDYPIALKSEVVLTGNDVSDAGVGWDQNQQPYVSMEFKPQGGKVFCDITTANVNKRFAIILDGKIRSAPNIRERICGGRASIEMGGAVDPLKDANTLSLVLRTGSLTAPVIPGEIRTVGSTLGEDAIRSGTTGMVVGFSFVVLFMGIWYRRAGLAADAALIINVLMVFAVLSLFGATLTLPGIAGIALTVGMAVDANIIIYERIREEMRLGQNARKAVETGFEKAVVAVLDANVTTAIAGVVLYSYGTGPIKGFAVTLLIGIGTTLVTALFVTRSLLEFMTRSSTARFRI